MSNIHINRPYHEPMYPESKKLSIPECRKIFEEHGYELVKGTFEWFILYEMKCATCQPYREPFPVQLKSKTYDKRTIQEFAWQLKEWNK